MDNRENIIELLKDIDTELFSIEIIAEAFIAIKENPKLTVKQALEIGIKEKGEITWKFRIKNTE